MHKISKEKLQSKSKVGIILRPSTPEIKENYFIIKHCFEKHNIEVFLERSSASMIDEDGYDLDMICDTVDFFASIGGDGTLISVVRRTFKSNKPVLGINLGNLGFLTDLKIADLDNFLDNLETDNYRIDSRMIIKGSTNIKKFFAFNDIVISRKSLSSMIKIDAKIDGKPFNSYFGDGVIISTPNGSTAYNLSVGGPLVYPLTDVFIVTPVAPHSLTQRPLVLPADFEIEFTVSDNQGAVVIVDGQDIYEVEHNQSVKIQIASKKGKLIHRKTRNYFQVLNEKLQWGK
ncbi:NAD(+) kinase [Malaciobacter molluscorum LMG 25693]|uniref:NAD kinase n=1 Tax=Malaciobacter molluscorum LMG 25693 TaxID=870501 RepID=A0A2G1DIU2_9BACT|nr:NAD(+)/NADH kinase [Malaciobacter molluscorum]AXX93173.1 inorganic polyphosphate/ATP-NAD kinase [Malaciobacter molluscorum LMG 25693]PHO18429.1 NAD(+) kinase [Malaciobacter molluscorum LMG 25693]RXJ95628.1 NAD(+) kinase [Malaciobacter molluscorum]